MLVHNTDLILWRDRVFLVVYLQIIRSTNTVIEHLSGKLSNAYL